MLVFKPTYTKPVKTLSNYANDKVICIMPCYNAQNTIKQAIESIINQSHTNWELIIVDDASTDKSVKIVQKYLKDSRITLLQNKTNRGCYYSRNRALYHVKDKTWSFFTTHDADDTSTHDRFSVYVNTFFQEKCESIVGVYNGKRWYNENNSFKLKYEASKSSVGTAWYTYGTFQTLGYYYLNRFGSDSEYKEKIIKVAFGLQPHTDSPPESVIKFMNPQYAYTYTTNVSNNPSLTKKYSVEEREQFAKEFDERLKSFDSLTDFYQNFEPHPEDNTL